jgi:hypothetical protein
MAIRVFETDPDAKPKERVSYGGQIGTFAAGRKDAKGNPVALPSWRILTGSQDVADSVAQLFGGAPFDTESANDHHIAVDTDAETVLIVVDKPSDLRADMKLWNRSALIHHCDGIEFLSPDDQRGDPCGCPETMEERKAAAKKFTGPSPSIELTFRLADDYELGEFRFKTGSWTLVDVLHHVENALDAIDGPALCELTLELVEYTTSKGRDVSYRKPVINVLKSYNDAIADAR